MMCPACGYRIGRGSRFCIRCGAPVHAGRDGHQAEEMNLPILYGMVAALLLAAVFPPWETPPHRPPEFLGFHFILSPPTVAGEESVGVVSRVLLTVELVTIAIAGLYFSWLYRRGPQ